MRHKQKRPDEENEEVPPGKVAVPGKSKHRRVFHTRVCPHYPADPDYLGPEELRVYRRNYPKASHCKFCSGDIGTWEGYGSKTECPACGETVFLSSHLTDCRGLNG